MVSRSYRCGFAARRRGSAAALVATAMIAAGMTAAPATAATTGYSQTAGITINTGHVGDSNATSITIGDVAPATPYPSQIAVTGHPDATSDVNVNLFGITHTNPDDLDVLLVGPGGQRVVLMSDAGGGTPITGVDVGLDDEAAIALPDNAQITSGTYRPANYPSGDPFPAPAPDATGAGTSLAAFDGTSPNGTWSLYLVDDAPVDVGSISGGWSLDITTAIPDPATPYPSTITVSGALNGVTDVNVGLKSFDHTFPEDVDVLVVGPGGQKAIILSGAGSGTDVVNADLVFDDQAAAPPTDPIVSGTFRPVNGGTAGADSFPAPAPADAPAAGSALSVFNGTNANGVWQLFVVDAAGEDAGDISGGWSLQISTGDAPAAPVITSPASGSRDSDGTITFAGTAAAGSTVKLSEAGVLKGTVGAGAGAWTLNVAGVANGSHTYIATATDAALNVSTASNAVTVIEGPVVDTKAPSVKATSPKSHKKHVKPKTNIVVTFSEAVRPGTLIKANVFLTKAGSKKKIKAKLSYSKTTHKLMLNPKSKLAGGTKYRVTVTSKVLDLAGNHLDQSSRKGAQAKTSTFTIR